MIQDHVAQRVKAGFYFESLSANHQGGFYMEMLVLPISQGGLQPGLAVSLNHNASELKRDSISWCRRFSAPIRLRSPKS